MKHLLQQIHDRSLWQVLGIYLAGSWVALQVVDTLNSTLGIPEWVIRATFVLLSIGLPIVIATAFVQRGWRRPEAGPGSDSSGSGGGVRLLTWKNAILGGVGAFALLGVGTAAWLGMRAAGIGPAGTLVARGVLDERDVILLADFTNSTGDATLADVVTEALRVDLSQSEAIRLADGGFISAALARMARPPESPLTEALAREMANREGLKALVVGEVARAGSGYVLAASVVTPADGAILVSHRESARDSTGLLDAIDALSRRIRERIGDPLASLANNPPLEQVTTGNLEALRSYTQALRLPDADIQRRLALLEDAVSRDSTFAAAWQALGIQLSNYGVEPGRAMEARTKAFRLRDRLTERERNGVASMFYLGVTNEPRQAIPFLEANVEADPSSAGALNNLGEAYRNLGDLGTALELYRRAVAVDSSRAAIPLMNIAQVSVTLGDFEGAMQTSALLDVYAPGPFGDWHRSMAATITRDYVAADRYARAARDSVGGSAFLIAQTTQWVASVAAIRGKIAESTELWAGAAAIQDENGSPVEALRNLAALAVERIAATGEPDRGRIDDALVRYPLEPMDPIERPYLEVAEAYALSGFSSEARRLVSEFEQATPPDFQTGFRYQRHRVAGEIALVDGRFDEAIAEFRQGASRPQELEPLALLARAFDSAGRADSARVYYRRFLDGSHFLSIVPHGGFLAGSLERLAQLEYEAGNLNDAARYLAEFVSLWSEADEELQPRVRAAQARLQEIYDAIG